MRNTLFICLGFLALQISNASGGVQLLVKWKEGPRSRSAAQGNARVNVTVVRNLDVLGWQIVEIPPKVTASEGVEQYRALPAVAAVEIDQRIAVPSSGLIPNDPMFNQQWYLQKISATNAWAATTGNTNVVVAVFDTGVDYTHPDLRDNLWRNPGEAGIDSNGVDKATNGIDDDGNGYADDVYGVNVWNGNGDPMDTGWFFPPNPTPSYHGTAVAGVIGAVGNNALGIVGINWSVKIMSIKVVSGDDTNPEIFRSYSMGGMLAAWNYVLEMKRRGVNIRVTSHSEGLTANSIAVREAIMAAGDAGILTVVAADNNAIDHDVFSTYANVQNLAPMLYVAATDQNDQLAWFSDYGKSTVHLAAPGVSILTTTKGGGYATVSGTSFACPIVAGAAALVASRAPSYTVNDLKAALMRSVDRVPALDGKVITGGRLNLDRAINLRPVVLPTVVVSALPAGQRTQPDSPIQVTFSRPMDPESVETNFSIFPPIEGHFQWSSNLDSFTFTHHTPFDVTTNYTVRLGALAFGYTLGGWRTLDGNFDWTASGLPEDDYVWTFRFPPLNDNFADALVLPGVSGMTNGDVRHTILEDRELDHGFSAYGLASVWYRWTAPNPASWFTFDLTGGTLVDSFLAIHTGNELVSLSLVASNDNHGPGLSSRVSFGAMAATNYSIAVVGKSAVPNLIPFTNSGAFALRWYPTPEPVITTFTPSSAYPGRTITISGTNFTGATNVLCNGLPAAFQSATNPNFIDLQLTVTIPANATTGPITIETPHGFTTSTNVLTVLPLPALTIRALPGTNLVELSWPALNSFSLQRASSFSPTGNWTSFSIISRLTNGMRVGTTTIVSSNRFFRLRNTGP